MEKLKSRLITILHGQQFMQYLSTLTDSSIKGIDKCILFRTKKKKEFKGYLGLNDIFFRDQFGPIFILDFTNYVTSEGSQFVLEST